MIEISVNLATHNRAAFLEPCLVSLCEQTLDPQKYEICVVNNACTDATPEVVSRIAARYPKHRVFMVNEPVPGLSRARNCGLRSTTAPLIANVDDDGTVYPNWLELFVSRFSELGPDVSVIGGEIEPLWQSPKPDWLTDKMEWFLSASTGLGPAARFLTGTECTSEGNSCFRRAALSQAGNFPEELGRAGACLLSGEQVVEAHIIRNGGKLFFDPAIVLRHFIHSDRLTPMWLRRRLFWQGVSSIAIRQYQLRNKVPVTEEAFINLPLDLQDWNFVEHDTHEKLEESMFLFYSLGFALTLTGLLPIESSDSKSTESNLYCDTILQAIAAVPDDNLAPVLLRRRSFWQGVAAYASMKKAAVVDIEFPPAASLPLDREGWVFINNSNEHPNKEHLDRLRNLGFVLAGTGFIPIK